MTTFSDDVANELDIEKQEEELPEEQKRLIGLCWQVFHNSDEGKKFLNLLEEIYNRNPVADPNLSPQHAYFNEGERNMLRKFRDMINIQKSILLKTR